jgi:hypothetical protein
MKLEFSLQTFEKYSNIKFNGIPSSGSRVVSCGRTDRQTDRHDEANRCFSQFCECAYKYPKHYLILTVMKQKSTKGTLLTTNLMVNSCVLFGCINRIFLCNID